MSTTGLSFLKGNELWLKKLDGTWLVLDAASIGTASAIANTIQVSDWLTLWNTTASIYTTPSGNTFVDTEASVAMIIANYATTSQLNTEVANLTTAIASCVPDSAFGTLWNIAAGTYTITTTLGNITNPTFLELAVEVNTKQDEHAVLNAQVLNSRFAVPMTLTDLNYITSGGVSGNVGFNQFVKEGISSVATSASILIDQSGRIDISSGSGQQFYLKRAGATLMKSTGTNLKITKNLACQFDVEIAGDLQVNGDQTCNGVKSFRISHPSDPTKQIKHACVESNKPLNCYRFAQVSLKNGINWLPLPSYFNLINANPSVQCSPCNTFCQWYSSVDTANNRVKIVCSKGEVVMDVIVYADRNDKAAQGYQDIIDKVEKPVEPDED